MCYICILLCIFSSFCQERVVFTRSLNPASAGIKAQQQISIHKIIARYMHLCSSDQGRIFLDFFLNEPESLETPFSIIFTNTMSMQRL
mmetsp:Transcript_37705/g.62043  ORF Transcript_37705/g.62043 Transcript_37705/m.62043 type:complete len:88 (-) Transcript_37705:457-720(-)